MARTSWRRRSDAVLLVQVLGVRAFKGVTNISSAISLDSWLTRISGNTPASRTAQRLKRRTRGPDVPFGAQVVQRGSQQAEKLFVQLVRRQQLIGDLRKIIQRDGTRVVGL